jgi:hypothetical protein
MTRDAAPPLIEIDVGILRFRRIVCGAMRSAILRIRDDGAIFESAP